MPNLMPDTSFYPKPQQQSPGSIIDLIQGMRKMQEQNAVGAATTNPANVNDPDAQAAQYRANAGPNANPETQANFYRAQQAITDAKNHNMAAAGSALSTLWTKPNPTVEDLNALEPLLPGITPKQFATIKAQVIGPDGKHLNKDRLLSVSNMYGGNASVPMTTTVNQAGEERPVPSASTQYGGAGGAGGAGGPGSGVITKRATGVQETQDLAAKDSAAFRATAGGWPQQQTNLENLRDLAHRLDQISGPLAGREVAINQTLRRLGIEGSLTAQTTAHAEEFKKIMNQIAQQQTAVMHPTDAGLANSFGANPNLEMSPAGRKANINMLLGNNDAIQFAQQQWNATLGTPKSGGGVWRDQDYYDFMNKFNKTFNPRVFQYERMDAQERKEFRDMISKNGPGALGKFTREIQAYEQNNYIGRNKGSGPMRPIVNVDQSEPVQRQRNQAPANQ